MAAPAKQRTRSAYRPPTVKAPNFPLRLIVTGVLCAPTGFFGWIVALVFLNRRDAEVGFVLGGAVFGGFAMLGLLVWKMRTSAVRSVSMIVTALATFVSAGIALFSIYALVTGPRVDKFFIIAFFCAIVAGSACLPCFLRLRNDDDWSRYTGVDSEVAGEEQSELVEK